MSYIVKKKTFELVKDINEFEHIVSLKNKIYLLKDFKEDKEAYLGYVERKSFLQMSGVKIPKIIRIDKKAHLVVEEYIEGEYIYDMLRNNYELSDRIYELIFEANFRARMERMNLDYNPKNFIYTDNDMIYYISDIYSKFEDEKSFVKKDIKLWFYTKDFIEELKKDNLPFDVNKLKQGYDINREMVLKTVKYYK